MKNRNPLLWASCNIIKHMTVLSASEVTMLLAIASISEFCKSECLVELDMNRLENKTGWSMATTYRIVGSLKEKRYLVSEKMSPLWKLKFKK